MRTLYVWLTLGAIALTVPALKANPTYTLNTLTYNFPLTDGGGGETASITGNGQSYPNLEIFCNDFANDIINPHNGYSAYLTPILNSETVADLSSTTRFGAVTSWNAVTISSDTTDTSTINGASALGRYEMAAYLTSLYNLGAGENTTNDSIQLAIWELLDPMKQSNGSAYSALPSFPSGVTSTTVGNELKMAAQWYVSPNNNNTFLANFRIVSDSTMTACGNGLRCGGFQEQITYLTPEPRFAALLLIGLLPVSFFALRKISRSKA